MFLLFGTAEICNSGTIERTLFPYVAPPTLPPFIPTAYHILVPEADKTEQLAACTSWT